MTRPALNASGIVLDIHGNPIGRWEKMCGGGRHSLTVGAPGENDFVLDQSDVPKPDRFLQRVSHKYSYRKSGMVITAVLAYDKWDDNTGGSPEIVGGGVNEDNVEILVTSILNRGFHFKFVVYGHKKQEQKYGEDDWKEIIQEIENSQELNIDDIQEVMDKISKLAGQWESVAQNLGVKPDAIGIIRLNRQGDAKMALNEAVTEWLKKNHNMSKFGNPTWRTLAKAVVPLDGALARKIAKKYTKGHRN